MADNPCAEVELAGVMPTRPCGKARKRSKRDREKQQDHPAHDWVAGVYYPAGEVDGYWAKCPGWPR